MSWVSVSARYHLKGGPKRAGITREGWNFAKDQPQDLSVLMAVICKTLVEFYANTTGASIESVNAELKRFAAMAAEFHMEDNQAAPPAAPEVTS